MPLRNILVSYNATDAAESALGVAMRLALRHEAHLTGILSFGPHQLLAAHSGYLPAGIAEQVLEADRVRRRSIQDQFRARTSEMPKDRVHFREAFGSADDGLMDVSHTYDIIVMGNAASDSDIPHMEPHPDVVALHAGRPVLVVPRGYTGAGPDGSALVAWDGRRTAARALADAMPLIDKAKRVTVLTVGLPEEADPLKDIAAHLARHGIEVQQEIWPRDGRRISAVILDACAVSGAGLLVMGAYEHSKFSEDLFGGVTNTLLRASPVPVLLSH